ncbi:MAG: NAD(P)-binding oxidoreductase [Chloroflexota bacterium]
MENKKLIAVFGGTGKVGSHFIEYALEAGYNLRVLVRNASKFTHADHDNVEVVVGDATNAEDVEKTVAGTDVVVSCLGPTSKVFIMEDAYRNIMSAAAKQPQPPRCLMISSIGMGGSSWLIKVTLTMIGGRAMIKDYERADKLVSEETKAPFVLARAYALTDNPGNGAYKILPGKDGTFARPISRADVALFFLHCVEDTQWDSGPVMLGGAKK